MEIGRRHKVGLSPSQKASCSPGISTLLGVWVVPAFPHATQCLLTRFVLFEIDANTPDLL